MGRSLVIVLVLAATLAGQELLYSVRAEQPWVGFGVQAVPVGDLDGDTVEEVAIGSLARATVRVVSGRDGTERLVIRGPRGFGASLAAGDVDADGRIDLVVGAPLSTENGTESGSVRVHSLDDGRLVQTFPGAHASQHFGESLVGADDVDGDGHADVFVGSADGAVAVVSGRTGATLDPPLDAGWFGLGDGLRPRLVGDVDGDHVRDWISASPIERGGPGFALVGSSRTGRVTATLQSGGGADGFGWSVADAGDVDGDGHADIIVGAPGDDTHGDHAGAAHVFSGHTGELLLSVFGEAEERLGCAVGGLGDVDGDGLDDVFVTAQQDGAAGEGFGVLRVYSSSLGYGRDATGI